MTNPRKVFTVFLVMRGDTIIIAYDKENKAKSMVEQRNKLYPDTKVYYVPLEVFD